MVSDDVGATKNPPCRQAYEGKRVAGSRRGAWGSADAPRKYENSGVHGTDIAPLRHRLSSARDRSLTM
ncbi:hypothetical protein FH715_26385 [Streptomyces sedi]|uniref:Uncharacterized protein n=1 Tax=Streptomyces sedi TaxID=555059 RepID=A0A5C4UQ07_9ACTN|nr:hypothetical protein FH715_26385 [Streptomyces sedi]